jgi:signal transduction histidine kinase
MRWRPGFKTKATAGFGAMLAATAVVTVVAVLATGRGAERATLAARAEAEDLLLTQRLRFRLERIVADGQGYLLFGDRELLSRVRESWQHVETTLQAMDARVGSSGGRAQLRKVTQTAGAYRAIIDRAVAERGATNDVEAVRRFERELRVHREELDASMDRLWNEEMISLEQGLTDVGRSAKRSAILIVVTAAIALLVGLLLAHIVIRELARLYEREGTAARRAQDALAARDELLAIIAHDLRSPLSAILMKAALIRRKADSGWPTPELRKQAEAIEATSRRMEQLIKSLLDAATIEAGHLTVQAEKCEARALLQATCDMLEPLAAEKSIHIDLRDPSGPYTVWADRERVLQVLSNLVTNAIKFTPVGGAISLAAEPSEGQIRFAVSDTGPGIPEEQRGRVFERFWKAEKSGRRGAGLGLYIARAIVEASGGRIWFETRVDQGTTFFFAIPSLDRPASEAISPPSRSEPGSAGLPHG